MIDYLKIKSIMNYLWEYNSRFNGEVDLWYWDAHNFYFKLIYRRLPSEADYIYMLCAYGYDENIFWRKTESKEQLYINIIDRINFRLNEFIINESSNIDNNLYKYYYHGQRFLHYHVNRGIE